jgi:DnaJ-class molecular chaperone
MESFMSIKKNFIVKKCRECHGRGLIEIEPGLIESCDYCEGTGDYIDRHYILIDEKNKIAVDKDTL